MLQRGAPPDLDKDPFTGVTADGNVRPGLFVVRSTGVTTKPVMAAAAKGERAVGGDTSESTA